MSRTDADTGTEAGVAADGLRTRTMAATADRAAGAPHRVPDRDPPHPWFDRPATEQERERIAVAAGELSRDFLGLDHRSDTVAAARRHVLLFLDWLDTFHGSCYQQRWVASGADQGGPDWAPGLSNPRQRPGIRVAASALILLGVIRPSDEWLLTAHLTKLYAIDGGIAAYHNAAQQTPGRKYLAVSVSVIAADTRIEAEHLAESHRMKVMQRRVHQRRIYLPSPDVAARARPTDPALLREYEGATAGFVIGDGSEVRQALTSLQERTQADELIVSTPVFEHEARMRSYRLVAGCS